MKKNLIVLSLFSFLLSISTIQAQVINVPEKSKDHFFKKYPDAKNADWNNNVASYAVKFQLNNETCRAYYHMDGTWDYTEKYLEESQLPSVVKESFSKSRYADWKKHAFSWIEKNSGVKTYRIEVEKGIEKNSIYFDKNGKEVKASKAI
jgi:hypothetical protein